MSEDTRQWSASNRMISKHNTGRRGQALVESTLILMAFLAIIIGALDFGQVLFFHQFLVERVSSGLRWGAVNEFNEAGIKNMIRYNQSTAGSQAFLGLTDSNISITRLDAGTSTERIQISIVDFNYHFLSPWITKTFTNNLAVIETLPTEYRP